MHFDFPTPKGILQATQKREKKRKESNKKTINEQTKKKKTDVPFNFNISGEKKKTSGQDANSLTAFS